MSNLDLPRAATRPVELTPVANDSLETVGAYLRATFTHLLGAVPSRVSVSMRWRVVGSNGVTQGMELDLTGQTLSSNAISVWKTDTKVYVVLNTGSFSIFYPDGTFAASPTIGVDTDVEYVVRVAP